MLEDINFCNEYRIIVCLHSLVFGANLAKFITTINKLISIMNNIKSNIVFMFQFLFYYLHY
jgi:hypothetical protein